MLLLFQMLRSSILVLILLLATRAYAQEADKQGPDLYLNTYLDIYYGFDFNNPKTPTRLPYFYHHNRHNSFNANHAKLALRVEDERYRANLGLQTGTYVADNYTAESDFIRAIYDANVGFALDKEKRLWLDAGIFGSSWIGLESTLNWDNMNLGHNLLSENVPYYFAGVMASYLWDNGLQFKLIVQNGWQRIQRVSGNSLPSFATQLVYAPEGKKYNLNWSTFIGTDDPDASRRMRYYNNFYSQLDLTEVWSLVLGLDIGLQQRFRGSSQMDSWWGMVAIAERTINDQWKAAARFEYYHDPLQVIVSSLDSQNGFKSTGISVNGDYSPFEIIKVRLEGRFLTSPDDIFTRDSNDLVRNSFFLLGAIVLNLDTKMK